MSKLNKTISGLLFYDDFSERTLMWQLSPSDADCIRFGDKGLQILHNRRYVTFTIPEPDLDEYSCIVELEHLPFNFDDTAGIIVLSSTKEYAECQTFLATGPSEIVNSNTLKDDIRELMSQVLDESLNDTFVTYSSDDGVNAVTSRTSVGSSGSNSNEAAGKFKDTVYRYIKFTKQKHKYMFWASEDSIKWIEVGNVKFDDSGVIGFFLYGTNNQKMIDNSHCYFKNFALYNGRYITIDGITRKYEFEIFDESGITVLRTDDIAYYGIMSRSNTRTVINTVNMPMPLKNGKLRVFKKVDDKEETMDVFNLGETTYGGDGFTFERNLKIFIDQHEVISSELFDLGTFFRGNYYIKVDIMNCEDYVVDDIKVRVIKYSEYYDGESDVMIALHDRYTNDADLEYKDLEYKKELIIPEIEPSESKSIYIKLIDEDMNQGLYSVANDYRFKIMID